MELGRKMTTISIATIQAALGQGINWIDTAAVSRLGHSEKVVAKALRAPCNQLLYSRNVNAYGTAEDA
jgi:aryl-alcohol dehydrogenase-like predicted oxidoreductase